MRQLLCSHCDAVNRVPEDRDAAKAKCGRCGEKVLSGQPLAVGGAAFEKHRRGTRGAAVLLDVWASWCGPCRAIAPEFEKAAARLEPDVRLLKLNSEDDPETALALEVRSIPALILFRDGEVVARSAGAMTADQIVAWARQALAGRAA